VVLPPQKHIHSFFFITFIWILSWDRSSSKKFEHDQNMLRLRFAEFVCELRFGIVLVLGIGIAQQFLSSIVLGIVMVCRSWYSPSLSRYPPCKDNVNIWKVKYLKKALHFFADNLHYILLTWYCLKNINVILLNFRFLLSIILLLFGID
jgi:hypothetical protein